ncbi:unnamed protein product [Rotaria sordida]|uniref:Helix-turn-helix domain-containing protein n=1 Tax=Rotaria sordida TaxID=392033 RepID=A0A819M1N8_9BILA|nr:unnamed protein product [Rotaria sordida]
MENNCHQFEHIADVFDIIDEETDDNLQQIMEEYYRNFDFHPIHEIVDEEQRIFMEKKELPINHEKEKIVETHVLSQKLSQLSTNNEHEQQSFRQCSNVNNEKRPLSTPSTPDVSMKRMRPWNDKADEDQEDDQVSDYFERLNDMFDVQMQDYLTKTTSNLSIDDLRNLAILKHRIAKIELDKQLWTIYLKLGKGEWTTAESNKMNVDQHLWSAAVKKLPAKARNVISTNQGQCEEQTNEMRVQEHIEQFYEKIEFYSMEYHEKKTQLLGFTAEMEQTIEQFIQQYTIVPFRMKLNYKIDVLEYNKDDKLLEREYLLYKPTENQIKIAKRIHNFTTKYAQAKQELIYLKQRILCNKPTKLFYNEALSLLHTSTTSMSTSDDVTIYQIVMDEKEKDLQQQMTDLVAETIGKAESKIFQCQNVMNQEITQMSILNQNQNEIFSNELKNLIDRRVDIIKKKFEYTSNFKINYFLQHTYNDVPEEFAIPSVCFSPTIILSTPLHLFTKEQLKLLNRGPSYVPPCQMYMSSTSTTIEKIIEEQYKSIQHDLHRMFAKCDINPAQSMFIRNEIKDLFTKLFAISIPKPLHQRALYEKQLIESIRQELQEYDLILRRIANQQNVFYLLHRPVFEQQTNEYMTKSDMFSVCENIDENNLQATRHYLTRRINLMNEKLRSIFHHDKNKEILKKLLITVDKVELPYLYFLPDISSEKNITVQPVVVAQHSETIRIAHFLDELLRPDVRRELDQFTFANGVDFIRKLNDYIETPGCIFRPTTNFITITISNFDSMVDHDTMLSSFQYYLKDPCKSRTINGISISKIYELTTLFLRNNRFYYDDKIYRFVKGSPRSFPFTETLATLYVLSWFKSLFRQPSLEKEFYGRYQNQLFLTWNDTKENLINMIKMANREDINIHVDIKMGSSATFLQAYIENQNGTFYSRVDHDSITQRYTIPYVIGNTKEEHSRWLRAALIRAVHYCTSVLDFNRERIYLEVSCLANGYTIEFVEKRIEQFFTHFDVLSLRSDLDQHVYKKLRLRLFNFVSEQKRMIEKYQELEKKKKRFRLSYLYDFGPKLQFNQQLRDIFKRNLNTQELLSKYRDLQLIVSTKNPYTLNAILCQHKPSHPLLNKDQ